MTGAYILGGSDKAPTGVKLGLGEQIHLTITMVCGPPKLNPTSQNIIL